jgi:hypothetical protein
MGVCEFLNTAFIVIPISYFIPTNEENEIHDDIFSTFTMIKNSNIILLLCFLNILFRCGTNSLNSIALQMTNAVFLSILQNFSSLAVWIIQLFLHLTLAQSVYGGKYPSIGESWIIWSLRELDGFSHYDWNFALP